MALFWRLTNVALLTGSVKGKKRKILLEQLENGMIDCLIGTHALIQDDVIFHNVGLVITDEQHRFGVNQRQAFRIKRCNDECVIYDSNADTKNTSNISFW